MDAIRQFIEVKNNSFNVVLPKEFSAKTVEVIIMPFVQNEPISDWQKEIVLQRIKNPIDSVDAFEMTDNLEKESIENL